MNGTEKVCVTVEGNAVRREIRAILRRAELALRTGRYADAVAFAQQVCQRDRTNLGGWETLAKAQWQAGEYDALLPTLRTLIALNPYEPGYHALRGAALQCLGRYGEATLAYERATGMPGVEESLRQLGAWQMNLVREMEASDPVFRAKYRQDPDAACAGVGLRLPKVTDERWLPKPTERTFIYNRPS